MSLDNYGMQSDNKSINVNDANYDVISLDNAKQINDPDCVHFFIKDGDTIGNSVAWICKSCKRGTYYPKGISIINS
jgi:hypothetical protein